MHVLSTIWKPRKHDTVGDEEGAEDGTEDGSEEGWEGCEDG